MSKTADFTVSSAESPRLSFQFVVATRRGEAEFGEMPIHRTLFERIRPPSDADVRCRVAFGNTEGLPAVYNAALDEFAGKRDFVVFMHDDIWVNDAMVFDKLEEASASYDLLGACGGKGWEPPQDSRVPLTWTAASKAAGMSGFMAHAANASELKGSKSTLFGGKALFATSYGDAPSPVLTLDGCFMCFTRKAAETGLRFDERFSFHFYDMDVSMSAFAKGLRAGTSGVLLTHGSLGTSARQPSYIEAEKAFLAKWFSPTES